MPKLAPAFVVTVSAIYSSACATREPHGNTPYVEPESAPTPAPLEEVPVPAPSSRATPASTSDAAASAAASSAPPPPQGALNPRTADGRSIMVAYQEAGCFVYLDYPPLRPGEQRPPGTAPPIKNVPCPATMSDPAYQACRGGVVQGKGDGCVCFVSGNPPRVRPSACPAK